MEEPEKIVSQTELDDRAQKLVEDKDADSRLRVYIGPMEKTLTAVLLIWAAFQVWANMFGTLGAVKLRTAHIMFLLPLAFTLYPTFKKERRRRRLMPVWDIALIAAAILSYGYLFLRYDAVALALIAAEVVIDRAVLPKVQRRMPLKAAAGANRSH